MAVGISGMQSASALLQLERVSDTRFRSNHNQDNFMGAIFGGQALCQSLAAAQNTVADWFTHSCAGQFLRAGMVEAPIDFDVETVRDGRRFASRRVLASQDGRPIFDMLCSFHDPEPGFEHQFVVPPPDAPDPESLLNLQDFARAFRDRLPSGAADLYARPFPIEIRHCDPERTFFQLSETPQRSYWLRMPSAAVITRPQAHACLLAFMSDYWFVGAAGAIHVTPHRKQSFAMASLNHSLWFHAPVRADQWLLFQTESPWAAQGRGLARGFLFDQSGKLIATVVQEASVRLR